tara:strand:- start:850 stop:954 length:105 start_codon:yes stop_codon:yes gene_type:complete
MADPNAWLTEAIARSGNQATKDALAPMKDLHSRR